LRLRALGIASCWLFCGAFSAEALAKTHQVSALQRLSDAIDLDQHHTITDLGLAFGLPLQARPTKWTLYSSTEHILTWNNLRAGAAVKAVKFEDYDNGSHQGFEVWVGEHECLRLSDMLKRFGGQVDYLPMPVLDGQGRSADSGLINAVDFDRASKHLMVSGMISKSQRISGLFGPVAVGECLDHFVIDGTPSLLFSGI